MKGLLSVLLFGVMAVLITNPAYAMEVTMQMDGNIFVSKTFTGGELTGVLEPRYTTAGNPANYVVGPGGPLAGVGIVDLVFFDGTGTCSGALLPSGLQVLTAAHCVTDDITGAVNLLDGTTVTFEGAGGPQIMPVIEAWTMVHPGWPGAQFIEFGNDIAILELEFAPTTDIPRYDIDRTQVDDVGSVADKTGYGRSGTGNQGDVLPVGTKRTGLNMYDALGDVVLIGLGLTPGNTPGPNFVAGSQLHYDFDNGNPLNDAFGLLLGIPDLGQGEDEVNSAPGDSGGPSQTVGVITGVTSWGASLVGPAGNPDVLPGIDSSFGEFSADTRVSFYSTWIDETLADMNDQHNPVVGGELLPIDSTALMLAGLQSSAIWMLPILAGAVGASAFFIRRR